MTIENYPYLEGEEGGEEEGGEGGEQFSTYDGGAGAAAKLNLNLGRAIISGTDGTKTRKKNAPGYLTQKGRDAVSVTRKGISFINPSEPIKKAAFGLHGIVTQTARTGYDTLGRRLDPAVNVKKEFDVNLPDDKKQKTTFDSYFEKVPSYFFSKDEKDEPYLVEYKIRTLRALASIKLYQTRKCLDSFFSTLEKCIDDAFIHGKNNSMRGVDKSKLVEVQLKDNIRKQLDDYLIESITAPILDVNYTMKLHKNIGDDDASSFIFYILQLCVIYYYPKYLLEIISNIIQQIFTSIYTDYTKLTNGDNSNIKQILSNLIASINDENDSRPIQAELTTHIDTYIKGINLQDEYSVNSRKVFFNALVNFAISISMYANREAIENTIASQIYERLKIDLEIKDDDDPNILASLKEDIKTKRDRLDTLRKAFDVENEYFEDKKLLERREAELKVLQSSGNSDITDLEKTVKRLRTSLSKEENELNDTDTPIAIKYNEIVRLQEEIKILEDDGPLILKAVNEDKRKWVTEEYIVGIIEDIWQSSPAGSNYKDEIFKHINRAVQSSSMFKFNVKLEIPDQATTTSATNTPATTTPATTTPAPAVLVEDPLDPARQARATMARDAAEGADNARSAVERAQQARAAAEERAAAAEKERKRREEAAAAAEERAAAAARNLARIRQEPKINVMSAQAPEAAQAQEAKEAVEAARREKEYQERNHEAAERERERVKAAAEREAALKGESRPFFDFSVGGKRRTRIHKKRAGTRRYKKRAGTRRHKKRKNRTR